MKRILAFDLGEKRIGLAISDELGFTAQRLPNLEKKSAREDMVYIRDLIHRYNIEAVVVGLPRHMSGAVGKGGEEALRFAEEIKKEFRLPVVTWDERLSTRYADRTLIDLGLKRKKRRQIIDGVSAQLILQSYLDSLKCVPK